MAGGLRRGGGGSGCVVGGRAGGGGGGSVDGGRFLGYGGIDGRAARNGSYASLQNFSSRVVDDYGSSRSLNSLTRKRIPPEWPRPWRG